MNATAGRNELLENEKEANAHAEPLGIIGRTLNRTANLDNPQPTYDLLDTMMDDFRDGVLELTTKRTLHIVLGTGGPHTEIRWPENGTPSIVCYGWWGSDRFERELTAEERTGLETTLGEWEDMAGKA